MLLVIDGRPSFKFQTLHAAKSLRAGTRLIVAQVKAFPDANNVELLKSFASEPSATNYVHIPGKKALKGADGLYVNQVVTQMCPKAESPSATEAAATTSGFIKALK